MTVPLLARLLLRCFIKARYRENLEGDLLEGAATGRTSFWCWRQVGCALCEHSWFVARQQAATVLGAIVFFLVALWVIAPATYPVMDWARALELKNASAGLDSGLFDSGTLRIVVLLGWLAGVPFVLGGVAGAAERTRHIGAILTGAAIVYLTPVTLPLGSAVCDLCAAPVDAAISGAFLFLTTSGSALLAGLGAWVGGKLHA